MQSLKQEARPKILVVDDNPANLVVIRHVLGRLDVELIEAHSGNDALRATLDHEFALVLLDVYMPDINGFEVASILSQEEHTRQIPFIFVTATYADDVHRLRGYGFGAVDYMAKPLNPTILLSKVQVFLELYRSKNALRCALQELSLRNRQLEEELQHRQKMEADMRHMAMHDALTGLPNRLVFRDRLEMAYERGKRHHHEFAVAYLDLDNFKDINDAWGHGCGDEVLVRFAQRLSSQIRSSDTAARLGGDEFALLLEEVGSETEVARRVEVLRTNLEEPMTLTKDGVPEAIRVEVSIGTAMYPRDGNHPSELLHVADQAMYLQKKRNRMSG
jgi:diguanylate cyclase (GGDEF)-like protein